MVKKMKLFKRSGECVKDVLLSKQLFNIYDEHIIRETVEQWIGGIFIGVTKSLICSMLMIAPLIASNEEEMAELVNLVEIAGKKLGLCINASKTKVMLVDRA